MAGIRSRIAAAAAALATALMLAAPGARADCVDGVREPTAAEREFAQRARAALLAGLPEAVRPLERRSAQRGDAGAPVPLGFCRGTPTGAFSPGASDGFVYQFTREEAAARSEQRRALLRQVEELEKLPPEKEAQRRDLEARMRAAYAAAPTRSRKDPPFTAEQQAQVDRAQAEGRQLEEAMRRVEFDHRASVKPQTDPLRARADEFQQGPQVFSVSLGMNVARFPDAMPPARGVVSTLGAPSPRQSATLQPVNVLMAVEGPAGPARDALVGLVDRAYLEGLLGRPLPDVAASKQRIDGNIARAAAAAPLAIAGSAPAAAPPAAVATPATAPAAPSGADASASAGVGAAAPAASAAQRSAGGGAPCPPAQSAQAPSDGARSGRDVGAEVGSAVLGGGWGRSLGASVGGALGALGGSSGSTAKKDEPPPADCPR